MGLLVLLIMQLWRYRRLHARMVEVYKAQSSTTGYRFPRHSGRTEHSAIRTRGSNSIESGLLKCVSFMLSTVTCFARNSMSQRALFCDMPRWESSEYHDGLPGYLGDKGASIRQTPSTPALLLLACLAHQLHKQSPSLLRKKQ